MADQKLDDGKRCTRNLEIEDSSPDTRDLLRELGTVPMSSAIKDIQRGTHVAVTGQLNRYPTAAAVQQIHNAMKNRGKKLFDPNTGTFTYGARNILETRQRNYSDFGGLEAPTVGEVNYECKGGKKDTTERIKYLREQFKKKYPQATAEEVKAVNIPTREQLYRAADGSGEIPKIVSGAKVIESHHPNLSAPERMKLGALLKTNWNSNQNSREHLIKYMRENHPDLLVVEDAKGKLAVTSANGTQFYRLTDKMPIIEDFSTNARWYGYGALGIGCGAAAAALSLPVATGVLVGAGLAAGTEYLLQKMSVEEGTRDEVDSGAVIGAGANGALGTGGGLVTFLGTKNLMAFFPKVIMKSKAFLASMIAAGVKYRDALKAFGSGTKKFAQEIPATLRNAGKTLKDPSLRKQAITSAKDAFQKKLNGIPQWTKQKASSWKRAWKDKFDKWKQARKDKAEASKTKADKDAKGPEDKSEKSNILSKITKGLGWGLLGWFAKSQYDETSDMVGTTLGPGGAKYSPENKE